jgi:hypothetical protein
MNEIEWRFMFETGRSKRAARRFIRRLISISMSTSHSPKVLFLVWLEWRKGLYRHTSLRAVLFAADRGIFSPVGFAQNLSRSLNVVALR